MKNALIVASIFPFINAFEKNNISILNSQNFNVSIATNFNLYKDMPLTDYLTKTVKNRYQINFSRSPFSKQTFIAYNELKKLINENKFDLIHCHTPVAAVLTRIAAIKTRKTGTKVIYTAHGFHFYKSASLLNFLIYYPIEKLCSYFTDALITINQEDFILAQKKLKAKKTFYIQGAGIDTAKLNNTQSSKTAKRKELGITKNNIMLLSVGELNKNKNHKVIIKALAKLKNENIHYFIAGAGKLQSSLNVLIKKSKLENTVHLLGYRDDVPKLCKAADIFCVSSYREGLCIAALEAMALGLPVIASNIRGINEYSVNEITGFLCLPNDINSFAEFIDKLAYDSELRAKMGQANIIKAQRFDTLNIVKIMSEIYSEVLNG